MVTFMKLIYQEQKYEEEATLIYMFNPFAGWAEILS